MLLVVAFAALGAACLILMYKNIELKEEVELQKAMVGITSYNMHEMHDLAWEAVRKAEAATENARYCKHVMDQAQERLGPVFKEMKPKLPPMRLQNGSVLAYVGSATVSEP